MDYINLGGHSGCKILLCEDDSGNIFVRKISKNHDYNSRLEKQYKKQRDWNLPIRAPKIFSSGITNDGLFYFDMEYIHGITLAKYMTSIEAVRINGIAEKLLDYILTVKKQNLDKKGNSSAFINKIDALEKSINFTGEYNKCFKMLNSFNWDTITESCAHGDLTTENIIIKNNEMYFIDFLDSFYDSWIMDMGTIFQDIIIMWAYRNNNFDSNLSIKLLALKNDLLNGLNRANLNYETEIYYTLLLKLLRMIPYSVNTRETEFLNQSINLIINRIERKTI